MYAIRSYYDANLLQSQSRVVRELDEKAQLVFTVGLAILLSGDENDADYPFLEPQGGGAQTGSGEQVLHFLRVCQSRQLCGQIAGDDLV